MKYQAGTTLVCVVLDRFHKNKDGVIEPKFKVLFRHEVPRTEFTYANAINKIIQLNDQFNFDWIAIDRGYGEVQLEMLKKYGLENPATGLHEKTVAFQFSENLEVRDPHTKKKIKKAVKPFMVNNSVIVFEREKIVLNPTDKILLEQFEGYKVIGKTSGGADRFSDENEHAVDALNLCLLILEQKHGSLFRVALTRKMLSVKELMSDNVESRDIKEPVVKEEQLPPGYAVIRNKQEHYTRSVSFGTRTSSSRKSKFSRSRF